MTNRQNETGYRGALPPRNDRLAAPWVITVIAIFVLMFVLSFLSLPSSLFPGETPIPLPSVSVEASASAEPSGSVEPSADSSATTEPSADTSSTAPSASSSP